VSDTHTELEYKLPAAKVSINDFVTWLTAQGPDTYVHLMSPDLYYEQGESTVRHRWGCDVGEVKGAGELTVKRRKDKKSTTSRVEVDLSFAEKVTREDVTTFLELTGWKRAFTVIKDCHIFNFSATGKPKVSIVIYDCWLAGTDKPVPKRFIEIEAAKGSNETFKRDKEIIDEWYSKISSRFDVEKPINKSLYEIFSGKSYRLV